MNRPATSKSRVWSWDARSVDGIECFRAQSITHHYGRHSHDGYAIGVIDDGVGGNFYRGACQYIPAGDIVVMNPDEAHTGYAAGDGPLSYRMLYIKPDAFQEFLPAGARLPHFPDVCIHNDHWSARLSYLHRVFETRVEAIEEQSLAHDILGKFARCFGQSHSSETCGTEPVAVTRIKEFLRANYWRNVHIDELTDLTELSRAYLIRAFHAAVGIPPYSWLLQLRVEQAKELLSRGVPIAQVSCEVGFADQSHLTRRFKDITGLTPGQYAAGHYRSRQNHTDSLI